MRIDIATLFTDMCDSVIHESIIGRGITNGHIEIYSHDIREYTENRHRRVDDKPYGGGTGMVMQAQPVYDCISAIKAQREGAPRIIYMSPQGETLTQEKVQELAREPWLILLCGHYEGIDQRVLDELDCEELSIGDYVLTGGELPALVVADAVARLQPGVLPNEDAYSIESHYNGLLEYPQFTRPEEWRGRKVPETLLTGDHKTVTEWQSREALRVTRRKRPDMHRAYINAAVRDFWGRFLEVKGLPENTQYSGIRTLAKTEEEVNMELKPILRGKKRSIAYRCEDDELPEIGGYYIITDWDGIPKCVLKIIRAYVVEYDGENIGQVRKISADDDFIDWFREYRDSLNEDDPVICEEFRLEYKGK